MRFLAVMLAGIGLVSRCSTAKIFSALLALNVPFYLALMGVTAARTVPQITSEMIVVRRACRARGGPIWKRNPYAWALLELRLLQTVVINSWKRSVHMAEALFTRGFDPKSARTELNPLKLRSLDWMVLGMLLICVACLGFIKGMFLLYRFDLYYNAHWREIYALARYWM